MTTDCQPQGIRQESQFTLSALFEYMTWCAVLAAFSALTGVASGVFLMLTALALGARQGLLALAMLMGASLAADWPSNRTSDSSGVARQAAVLLLAGALCEWRPLRERLRRRSRNSNRFDT